MTTAIDLFAGAGGFTTGATQAGARVLWAANHWLEAVKTHHENHPDMLNLLLDLTRVNWQGEVPQTDLVLASPACQGFSRAATAGLKGGKRYANPRHDRLRATPWVVVDCAEFVRPKFLVVENVTDFKTWGTKGDGALYKEWKSVLGHLGYKLTENVLNAKHFGVPQDRERLFIVAVHKRHSKTAFPKIKPPRGPEVPFADCVDWSAGVWSPVSNMPKGRPGGSKKGGKWERYERARKNFPRGAFVTHDSTDHTGRDLKRPIGTITTKHQWGLVRPGRRGDEYRMLTADEYRCAMGFPADYAVPNSVTLTCKLMGNAVCPPMARAIVRQIMKRG